MKKNLFVSLKLTAIFIVLLSIIYPLLIAGIGKMAQGGGNGEKIQVNGKIVGYANIGQQFTNDNYFQGRPSAVAYNAAGSGGSNKGPSNPDYLAAVQQRIDTFLVHNPGITKTQIPADLVTASGSGLDPDISPDAAYVQVKRIASVRNISEQKLNDLVAAHIQKPLLGLFGPSKVNVLKLNIAVDALR
jgi:potassium-transporting ATPase KdpC subunit